MPTASQCQVINNIVRRESQQSFGSYLFGEANSSDETSDGAGAGSQASASAALETTRPTLNAIEEGVHSPIVQRRPATSVVRGHRSAMSPISTQESIYDNVAYSTQVGAVGWGQRRSVISSRAKSANPRWTRLLERHYEITTFQKQCMDNVERSISGAAKKEVDDVVQDRSTRASSAKEEIVECAHGREIHEQEVRTPDANDERTVVVESPLVRFKSTVKVYEKTSESSNDTTDHNPNLEIQNPVDPEAVASAEEAGNLASETDAAEMPLNDVLPEKADPFPFTMFGSKLTDEMKARLYELGWRKPSKRSKKKMKKEEDNSQTTNIDLSNLPSLMDLKKDPMLRRARKTRIVPIQTKPPEPNPTAVCFNFLGSSLTHRDVWLAFKRDILAQHPEVRIRSIQFVPRAIFIRRPKGGDPIEDRWIITFTSEWFRNRVAGMEIKFRGVDPVQLRRYDDIANCEYRQYTRMNDYMKMVSLKK